MAYLNSRTFTFYYNKLFGEIKILKNNLMEIPFPKITKDESLKIENLVNEILKGSTTKDEELQKVIYKTYNLTDTEIKEIEKDEN